MHVLTLKPENSKIQNCHIEPPKGVTIQIKAIQLSTCILIVLFVLELKVVHFLAFAAAAAAAVLLLLLLLLLLLSSLDREA